MNTLRITELVPCQFALFMKMKIHMEDHFYRKKYFLSRMKKTLDSLYRPADYFEIDEGLPKQKKK